MDEYTVIPLDEVIRAGAGALTDADILEALIATDTIRAVAEDDGTMIADGDGAVLLM